MTISRRSFLRGACALAAIAALPPSGRVLAQPRFPSDPFTLGVASGYPHAHGVTLWTRLAGPALSEAVHMAHVEVQWEVAHDEAFRAVAARGSTIVSSALAHAAHVDVAGLEPARTYWYRFRAGDALSPTGRTRTAPLAQAHAHRMRFAFAACQQYEHGYYAAYRHMVAEDLDLVVHLGDYVYESSWGRNHVRKHDADEPYTLAEYRDRYALYKSDRDLQAAHAAFPWVVTWDDHEVDNDYANDRSQDLDPRDAFLARRAAAYQAYYEHMPLPQWARPRGHDMRIHAHFEYGTLARFFLLDTRQYRSHQVCAPPERGGSTIVREEECHERLDERRSMLGAEQEKWLHGGLTRPGAHWNVIAQQTLMARADRRMGPGADYWTDGWDGYPRARQRLLTAIAEGRVSNPLVLSGDVHMAAAADLKIDFDDPRSPVVATEFVCPSISSQGPSAARVERLLRENPHLRFAEGRRRGYATVELTREACTTRFRTVSRVTDPRARISTLTTYAVESGRPGAHQA